MVVCDIILVDKYTIITLHVNQWDLTESRTYRGYLPGFTLGGIVLAHINKDLRLVDNDRYVVDMDHILVDKCLKLVDIDVLTCIYMGISREDKAIRLVNMVLRRVHKDLK